MFSKATFVLAFVAVAKLAVATPPACLLAAVNEQPDPSDLKSICGSASGKVKSYISSNCGDYSSDALSAFKSTCSSSGYEVSGSESTSESASKTASETGSKSGSKTASSSATATGSGSHGHGGSYGSGYLTVPLSTGYGVPTGYSVVATSTYFDSSCSCTKTAAIAFTGTPGAYSSYASGGLATTAHPAAATTYAPAGSANGTYAPTGTSTANPSTYTGAADRTAIGSFVGMAAAVVGLFAAL